MPYRGRSRPGFGRVGKSAKVIVTPRGWLANIHGKLQALDNWLRKRLRYCIWHHWKRPERKRKNLMRLGVDPENAYAWSRTRMGGWKTAQSPILKTTITLSRLKKRGYIAMLDDWCKSNRIPLKLAHANMLKAISYAKVKTDIFWFRYRLITR